MRDYRNYFSMPARKNVALELQHIGTTLLLTFSITENVNIALEINSRAGAYSRSTCCHTRPMWKRLDRLVDDFFEGITLKNLMDEAK